MKLVHVIPIAKGIQKSHLSYFSKSKHEIGSLVFVPIRNKTVPAIVVGAEVAKDAKAKLRSSDFAMKKVSPKADKEIFLPQFIKAAVSASDYFCTSVGSLLHQAIPAVLLNNADSLPESKAKKTISEKDFTNEVYAFQSQKRDRVDDFKRIVREEFARDRSTYILSPTIKHAEYLAEELGKGVEQYVYVLHSNLSKKETLKRTENALKENHPVLIVGTGGFLAIPRADIGTIVVENESSKAYKMQSRPYLDYRIFARLLAYELGARLILSDMPLSIETMWRLKQKEYEELSSTRARVATTADQYIIDMKPEKGSGDFFVLSSELTEKLKEVMEKGGQAFVFNVRKGIAPTTLCEECGSVVTCALCGASVVLHSAEPHNVFVCHGCGHSRSAKERCSNCDSWKLKALGIGSERVKRELVELFGSKRVFSIDKDSTKTYKQAQKVAEQFYKTNGAILVGTEMSLSFIEQRVSLSAIASIDSLLSLPDPKMYENIFSLILRVRSTASDTFILQTRQPDLSIIKEAVIGNVTQFYEGEILNRKRFEYPPFTQLIKITSTGTVAHISKEMEELEEMLKGYPFHIYPAFSRTSKNTYALSGLLKIPYEKWPDKRLIEILRNLPPNVAVNVSPESTL
jgi:primosomal protein N' (replication factor Y)